MPFHSKNVDVMETKLLDAEKKIFLISTSKDLDATHTSLLLKELKTVLAQDALKIIIDLRKIDFVSSSGIGVLASTGKNLAQTSGKLTVVCENEKILSLLKITNLDCLISSYASIEEAQAAL